MDEIEFDEKTSRRNEYSMNNDLNNREENEDVYVFIFLKTKCSFFMGQSFYGDGSLQ